MNEQKMSRNANVILITIDCLRGDHLSCNGYQRETTPFLDELAKKGINFSKAMSTGCWTAPSFISILTSTYPMMYDGYVSMTKHRLSIAEVLSSNGYICAGFPFHPFMDPIYKYNRGFDVYQNESENINRESIINKRINYALNKKIKQKNQFKKLLSMVRDGFALFTKVYRYIFLYDKEKMRAESINDKVINWLKTNHDKKFFLWLHYLDIHPPYLPPFEYINRPIGKLDIGKLHLKRDIIWKFNNKRLLSKKELDDLIYLYDSNISYVDDQIKFLLNKLDQVIDMKKTYVIITADHGEQFLEHGGFDHEFQLYEELIHVPLIIFGPNLPSKNIDTPVSLIDISPTILDLIGIKTPPDFIGSSMIDAISGDVSKNHVCFSEEGRTNTTECFYLDPGKIKLNLNHKTVSIRGSKWKYIFKEGRKDELYNLVDDPEEKNNLVDNEKNIAYDLRDKIDKHLEEEKKLSKNRDILKHRIGFLKESGKI